jgi:hypothetical protein
MTQTTIITIPNNHYCLQASASSQRTIMFPNHHHHPYVHPTTIITKHYCHQITKSVALRYVPVL